MHLLQRILFFIALLVLANTAPWYVALVVLLGFLSVTGWYELAVIALLIDTLLGAGVAMSAIPIATILLGIVCVARELTLPSLMPTRSTTTV